MKAETLTPADTRTMGIVHRALLRDLTRATDALTGPPFPGDAQRAAIAQHVQAMMNFLHVHHGGEDAWLWPTMRRLNPLASELLDQMEDDHLAIVPHMEKVTSAAGVYEKRAAGREALVGALSDLRGRLDPHLRREENDMMPIVATTLTARQWDGWEKEYYLKSKSKSELGMEGHWLIDGADRSVYDHVVGKVNPVLRFVLLRYFGPKYRQACTTRWGAGVSVGPTPN
jgi:hemerythrin-like domain-containing protein